jgi:phospholipid/cholesterol/gamma-HCH transport system substrate-binding protein
MDDRVLQLRVGAVVVVAALAAGILIMNFGEGWKSQYRLYLKPLTAPGVTKGTPVRKHGILIGRVHKVETLDDGVLLTLAIYRDETLYANEVCRIGTATFLGDAVIDVLPGTQADRGPPISPGERFPNVLVQRDPLELINVVMNLENNVAETLDAVRRAGNTIDEAGQSVRGLSDTIREALGEEDADIQSLVRDFRTFTKKAETAIDNFNSLMVNFNEVIGDAAVKDSLRKSLADSPELFSELKSALAEARSAFTGIEELTTRANTGIDSSTRSARRGRTSCSRSRKAQTTWTASSRKSTRLPNR